jgi:hypothetical protein
VLVDLAARVQAGEDPQVVADELFGVIEPWLRGVVVNLCRTNASTSRNDDLESQVMMAAYLACRTCDWDNVVTWPALLRKKVSTARAEVTRASAWAGRRHARLRNAWQREVDAEVQRIGRSLTDAEERTLLQSLAPKSSRTDWVSEVSQWKSEPVSVALFTEEIIRSTGGDPAHKVVEADEKAKIDAWLHAQLPPRLAADVAEWLEAAKDHDRALPRALRSRLQPYFPALLGLVAP